MSRLSQRRFTFGQGEIERDIDDELALHLELLTQELVERGWEPGAARREAESRFGDRERHRRACRELFRRRQRTRRRRLGLQEMAQDVRFTFRGLRRSPAFAFLAALTLALGIGSNTAIFSVLDAVLLQPLPYESPERLVEVWESALHLDVPKSNTSYVTFRDLRSRSASFDALAAVAGARQTLTGLGEPRRLLVARVSEDFFAVARRSPLVGRTLEPEDFASGRAAVLSYELWNRLFGGESAAVGRTIELDDESVAVVGVMPPGFDLPYGELWRPLIVPPDEARGYRYFDVYGRLKPGVDLEAAQAELDGIIRSLAVEYPKVLEGAGAVVEPLREALVGEVRPLLVSLFAAVGLLLLIACANVAHLTLARAASRHRELAVRASLGAGQGRLLRQLVTESLVLAAGGGLLGLVFAHWGLEISMGYLRQSLPRLAEVRLDAGVLAFTWSLTLLCGLAFGLVPGRQVARANLSDALRAGGKPLAAPSGGLRRALVVLETALALVLVLGAGLLVRSFVRLLEVDPGFRPENVVATQLVLPPSSYPEERQHAAFFERLVEEVEALPSVISAGVVQRPPLRRGFNSSFSILGRPRPAPNHESLANVRMVSADYFRTMGIELVRGRSLDPGDTAEAPWVVVINETFARRHFPGEEPLGRSIDIHWRNGERRVVGVVADVKLNGLEEDAPPAMYVPHTQDPFATMTLVVRTTAPLDAIAPELRARVWALDPRLAVDDVHTLESRLADSTARRRFTLLLLAAFAAVALVMASVGIYGVIAQLVAARTREIGLRVALGATARDVMRLVLGRGMAMAAAGIGLGIAAAAAMSRWISALLFEVSALDPATFLAVTAILAAVALVACWVPARRALRVDPMRALHWE